MGSDGTRVTIFVDVEPEVGDVVVFHGGDRHGYVQHRVVEESDRGFVTEGDAYDHVDQPSTSTGSMAYATGENTRGVVVATVPLAHIEAGLLSLLAALLATAGALDRREVLAPPPAATTVARRDRRPRRLLLAVTVAWVVLVCLQVASLAVVRRAYPN